MTTICFDVLRGGHSVEVSFWPRNITDFNEFFSWLYDLDYEFYEEQYRQCDQCGAWEHYDYVTWAHDEAYCEYCASNNLTFCDGCQDYHDYRQVPTYTVYEISNGRNRDIGQYCRDSIDNTNFIFCDSCNDYFTENSVHYSENDDMYYCESCYEESDDCKKIHDYSYKPRPEFYGNDGLHMGIELEVEFERYNYDVAKDIMKDSRFYMKRDGSLDNGIEFVTHPLTYGHHASLLPRLIESIKDSDDEAKSHNVSTCGLHIHVGRDKLKNGAENRLAMFFTHCSKELEIFGRRKNNSYAKFHKEFKKEFYKAKSDYKSLGKYSALNLGISKTIELRFFKGTLKIETLLASIEFTELLINFCNNKHSLGSKPSLFWSRFLDTMTKKGSENLKKYLVQRKLLDKKALQGQIELELTV